MPLAGASGQLSSLASHAWLGGMHSGQYTQHQALAADRQARTDQTAKQQGQRTAQRRAQQRLLAGRRVAGDRGVA